MTEQTEDIARKEAYRLLDEGVRLLNAGRYGEALDALRQADDLLPDDPDIMITLSGAMIMAGKWNAAERFLEEAVTKRPENPRLWLNLAAARLGRLEFSTRQRQEQAIAAYERAIELDPVAPSAHYNVGLIHAERQDWEQAIRWFEAAIRANPADKDARLWLKRARAAYEASQQDDSDGESSS
jgi:tetratricopeptide (TPR) repeat protein